MADNPRPLCDRCGALHPVPFNDCPTCGPILLCPLCIATHVREMEEKVTYGSRDAHQQETRT